MALEKDNGGKIIINENLDKVIRVDIETKNEFMDIDTIEDYEKVKNMDVINRGH
jgi:CTP:molybdopterin cytidylyltransferase MocA